MPLEALCLTVKAAPGALPLASALARLISPPQPEAVEAAVQALHALGALDDAEALTPLGRHLTLLPMDARLAKTLVYGVMLRWAPVMQGFRVPGSWVQGHHAAAHGRALDKTLVTAQVGCLARMGTKA